MYTLIYLLLLFAVYGSSFKDDIDTDNRQKGFIFICLCLGLALLISFL